MTATRRLGRLIAAALVAGALAPASADAATPQPVGPWLVTGVPGTTILYVVRTTSGTCSRGPCLQLERTTVSATRATARRLPPLAPAPGSVLGNLSQLVFANSLDGYAALSGLRSFEWYVTTNGAMSWRRVRFAPGVSLTQLVATGRELYGVVAHCARRYVCTDYRLARSSLDANQWTFSPLPAALAGGHFALAAYGANVWANFDGPNRPQLFVSRDGGRTFTEHAAPLLASVSACDLTPTSATVLWAECPTGMMVSFFYSQNAGSSWAGISRYAFAGTGGGAFDPVSSSLAYLDFGPFTTRPQDLYAIDGPRHTMRAVGNLRCTSADNLVFVDASHGVALCVQNTTSTTTTSLRRTTDGGATWTIMGLAS